MVRPAGLEPAAFGSATQRSNPLSYGRVNDVTRREGIIDLVGMSRQHSWHRHSEGNSLKT